MTAATVSRRTPKFLLNGVLPIDRARFPLEVAAGATLAALAIPETMGYAAMAGMPPATGLYTLILPIALFALLGSSRHLVVGADSATAVVCLCRPRWAWPPPGLAAMGRVGRAWPR